MQRGQSDEENKVADDEDENEDEDEDEDEEKDDTIDLIDVLTEHLPSLIALLSLFSNENNYNCGSIVKCIESCKHNLDGLVETLCNCDNDAKKSSILACYMNQSDEKRYDKKTLVELLDIILDIINRPESEQLAINLDIIFSTIRESMGKNDNALIITMSAEDVQEKIKEYLPVREEEKDKFGEVFTPAALINEMLDKLPPGVWSDPTKKWLDPANGIGNFPMIVYKRLFSKLPDKYDKDGIKYSDKSKHILQNMLYMCEINKKNIAISRRIFGPNANICCCDFLNEEEKWKKQFGIDKFDVIIGNPPFNAGQVNEGKKGGGDSLWPKFVKISIVILKSDGYLLFVHPAAWRKPESENSKTRGLFNLMAHDNHIDYLEIHNTKDGLSTFNAGTRYDWYLLQKNKNNSKTTIKDELGKIHSYNLNEWNFLPNYNFELLRKLLNGKTDNDYVIYSASIYDGRHDWVFNPSDKNHKNKNKNGEYKYPLIHTTTKDGPVIHYTSTKTPLVKTPVPMFGVPKVIFGDGGINDVIIDDKGKYGLTQHAIGLKISSKHEGELMKVVLESDEFDNVLKSMSFSNFGIDWRMFKYFKPDFYKQFLGKALAATKIQSVTRGKLTRKKKGGSKPKRKTRRKR